MNPISLLALLIVIAIMHFFGITAAVVATLAILGIFGALARDDHG